MTYPPQQPYGGQQPPATGGFSQPPDPYSQPQPGGYPGRPGQPGFPGQPVPYGYPPQGQPGPGGPQGPYGPPPGYGFGAPPGAPKKKTGLIIGAIIAVVVLVGGGTGAYFLFSGPGPEQVAERAAQLLSVHGGKAQDPKATANLPLDEISEVLCTKDVDQLRKAAESARELLNELERLLSITSMPVPNVSVTVTVKSIDAGSNTGTVTFARTMTVNGKESQDEFRLDLLIENDKWVVCGIANDLFKVGSSGSRGSTRSSSRSLPSYTFPTIPSSPWNTFPSLPFPTN